MIIKYAQNVTVILIETSATVKEPRTVLHLMFDNDCQQHSQGNLRGTPNYDNGAGADHAPVTISESSISQQHIIGITAC